MSTRKIVINFLEQNTVNFTQILSVNIHVMEEDGTPLEYCVIPMPHMLNMPRPMALGVALGYLLREIKDRETNGSMDCHNTWFEEFTHDDLSYFAGILMNPVNVTQLSMSGIFDDVCVVAEMED